VRIARGHAAAVDEGDCRDPLRGEPVGFQHDPASHAVSDQHRGRIERPQQLGHVRAVAADRALAGRPGRAPVPAQVARKDEVPFREVIDLRAPVLVRAGKSVDENERWGTFARPQAI